jgi:hypothetical protein
VHRDDRGRGQPVAEAAETIGRNDVVSADHRAAGGVVLDARKAQPSGRVDDDKSRQRSSSRFARLREAAAAGGILYYVHRWERPPFGCNPIDRIGSDGWGCRLPS